MKVEIKSANFEHPISCTPDYTGRMYSPWSEGYWEAVIACSPEFKDGKLVALHFDHYQSHFGYNEKSYPHCASRAFSEPQTETEWLAYVANFERIPDHGNEE